MRWLLEHSDDVPKRLSSTSLDILHICEDLIAKIRAAAESRHSRRPLNELRKSPRAADRATKQGSHCVPAVVALGISTGGPKALQDILPALPVDLPVPILIVQHMPAGFIAAFAKRLNSLCAVRVCEASDGETVEPGVVYLAPAGFQMKIDCLPNSRMLISLSGKAENQVHVPSVDVLMQSVASAFHSQAMGIIMTGMGSDGAQGMKAIVRQPMGSPFSPAVQFCIGDRLITTYDSILSPVLRMVLEYIKHRDVRHTTSLTGSAFPHSRGPESPFWNLPTGSLELYALACHLRLQYSPQRQFATYGTSVVASPSGRRV